MSPDFQSIEADKVHSTLLQLFDQVIRVNGRIEFMSATTGKSCVLISKTELDSLERALEILSNTDACQQMRDLVATVAAHAEPELAEMSA